MSKDYKAAAKFVFEQIPSEFPPGITVDDLAYFFKMDSLRNAINIDSRADLTTAARNIFANIESYKKIKESAVVFSSIGNNVLHYSLPVLIVATAIIIILYVVYFAGLGSWLSSNVLNFFSGLMIILWSIYFATNNKIIDVDPSRLGVPSFEIGGLKI